MGIGTLPWTSAECPSARAPEAPTKLALPRRFDAGPKDRPKSSCHTVGCETLGICFPLGTDFGEGPGRTTCI